MRRQGFTPCDDRRFDGDRLPVIGEVICVHIKPFDPYLARIIDQDMTEGLRARRYYILPLGDRPTGTRVYSPHVFEPTVVTFEGYVCWECRKVTR